MSRAFAEFVGGPNEGTGKWRPPLGADGMPPAVLTFVTAPGPSDGPVELAPPAERRARYVRSAEPDARGVWVYVYVPEPPPSDVP